MSSEAGSRKSVIRANTLAMVTLGQRIQAARVNKQLSQSGLARQLGISRNAVSQWEHDATVPKTKTLLKIGRILSVDLDEFATARKEGDLPLMGRMPVRGEARARAWVEIEEEKEITEYVPLSRDPAYDSANQYALKVVGDSMDRKFPHGTYAIVAEWTSLGAQLKDGDYVVIRRERSKTYEVTIKRAKFRHGQWELWPESTNPQHQVPIPYESTAQIDVQIIGKVIGKYERV